MGMRTDAAIAAWQEEVGTTPASGEVAETLDQISKAAFATIRIVVLEASGIREGDGHWYGCCPLSATLWRLTELHEKLLRRQRAPPDGSDPFELSILNDALCDHGK